MRVALPAAIAAAIAVSSGATAAAATPSRSTCAPAFKTIRGHKAVGYCGPATASLHIGGKSYSFKSGSCIWAGGTLILDVGTQVNGLPASTNDGQALLALNGTGSLATAYAFTGRFHLGMSIVKLAAHGHAGGTFTGREPIGATLRFTGSFHC
jgi:hypothetical protein